MITVRVTKDTTDPGTRYLAKLEDEYPCAGDNACAGGAWAFYGSSKPCNNCWTVAQCMDLYEGR